MKKLLVFALLLIASPAMAAPIADCPNAPGCYDHTLIRLPPPTCAPGEAWTGTIVCDDLPTVVGTDAKVCGVGRFSCQALTAVASPDKVMRQPLSVQDTDSQLAMVVFGYEGLLK
jgi:hypothetical protein